MNKENQKKKPINCKIRTKSKKAYGFKETNKINVCIMRNDCKKKFTRREIQTDGSV